jgi:hypothetical protein
MEKWIFDRKRIVSDVAAIGKREVFIACVSKTSLSHFEISIERGVFGGQFVGLYFYTYIYLMI